MNSRLLLYLSQKRAFWWLRTRIARLFFEIEADIFGVRYGLKEIESNYLSLRHLFNVTQKPLFISVGFAALLLYIDPYLSPYFQRAGISVPDDGDYATFLATVSGIGGVFIGLYYAGIIAVGSAIYSTVPNNVRDLLAHERHGNVYMLFLSFLTFVCLELVALRLSGFPRLYSAIPIVTLLVGVGIISFMKLGQQAFYLFDPTKLSSHVFEQLSRWLRVVKAGAFRWQDKAFQNHARKMSSTMIDALDTISEITASKTHLSGRPFIVLAENIIRFLIHYESAKRSIPTESLWYEQRYHHRDWYRTDDSRVSIAHQTGTALEPDVTNDKEWIERRVFTILKTCIETNLIGERYSDVLELFAYLDEYVKQVANEGEVERAFDFLWEISSVVLGKYEAQADAQVVSVDALEKLAVAERLASLPISVALGYQQHLEKVNRDTIEQKLSLVRWADGRSIYNQEFPTYCLPRLEWFSPRLEFEKMVEGHNVTPLWYQAEMIRQVGADRLSANTKLLIEKGSAFYSAAIAKALSSKHLWLAAAIMSREWEYWHKVENQIGIWPSIWESLSNDRRIQGLPWSDFSIDTLRGDSEKRQHALLGLMSQQNLLLALVSRPEGFPDYAGQFLHTSGEVALDALLGNNVELLKSVFRPYLMGCLLRFDALRPKAVSIDWRVQQDFKIAAAALLDVMDVSGYAKLLSDLHGNKDLWNEVTAAWSGYLGQKHPQSPLPLLAGAIAFTEIAFEMPHRAVLRTTWKQKIMGKLSVVPRHESYYPGRMISETVIDHTSPLVRIFARGHFGGFHDGIDLFIAYFLRDLDDAKDLDFGSRRRDIRETVARDEQNQEHISHEEPDQT